MENYSEVYQYSEFTMSNKKFLLFFISLLFLKDLMGNLLTDSFARSRIDGIQPIEVILN
jgi:hypothetical protein